MGRHGPQPKPLTIERIADRKRAAAAAMPLARSRPDVPEKLDDAEARIFGQVCDWLDEIGILNRTDSNAIERYAVAFNAWRKLAAALRRRGETVKEATSGERGPLSELLKISAELRQLDAALGLTPAARAAIASSRSNAAPSERAKPLPADAPTLRIAE